MKKILSLFSVSILSGLILLVISAPAQAADVCAWTKSETKTVTTMASMTVGGTITTEYAACPGNSKSGSSCDGDKPDSSYLCCCVEVSISATNQPKIIIPEFQVKIPGLNKLSDASCANGTCQIPWISEYAFAFYSFGLNIVGVLAVLVLMAAGVLWIVSGGDTNKIARAKKLIAGSATGLILIVGANLILSYINPELVKKGGISLTYIDPIGAERDTDVTTLGSLAQSANPYQEGCNAARKGDLSICRSYGVQAPQGLSSTKGKHGTAMVHTETLKAYEAAMECVKKKNGGKELFIINEGWRSAATQIAYKKDMGANAATPCCSNHGSGQALDVNRRDGQKMNWDYNTTSGLKECMNAQGLYANLTTKPDEPWHWSPTGK